MSPTIYDIARVAKVSKSTVSRVLNNQTNISPQARERVLKAIEELNYQPNIMARALSSAGFDAILVITTRSTKTTAGNPFFSEVLHAITARAEKEGFDVILQTSKDPQDALNKCLLKIRQKMIKGIIMLSSPMDDTFYSELEKCAVPVVVIGKVAGNYRNIYSVDTDNFGDSQKLTEALIARGHRRLACLHAPLDHHVSVDRLAGFKAALEKHHLDCDPSLIVDGGYTQQSALAAAETLLSLPSPPDAIFVADSLKMVGVYRAAAMKNIVIAQQLSIIGYGNEMLSLTLTPEPGGINVPTQSLGEKSSEVLFDIIAGRKAQPEVIIPTRIVLKGSLRNEN
ncbi:MULTISPECIES: LacI family DNA-binding transcriptional regulator [Franconibacter]|uniref:LacI family transcriptional regulator n=2 Tax=Franconibacter TaxID=1649295 RepID=A0A0J8VRX5_9ENTR|nr:LacI family DNA-binding transcriptional regulator [Franconibacter pulveris]KMV35672.1 LacI family transcriptional regulator [Franconibacter pulveris]